MSLQSECCREYPGDDAVYHAKDGVVGVCPKCGKRANFMPPDEPERKPRVFYGRMNLPPSVSPDWVQRDQV